MPWPVVVSVPISRSYVRRAPVGCRRSVIASYHYRSGKSHNHARPSRCCACSQEGQACNQRSSQYCFPYNSASHFLEQFHVPPQPAYETRVRRKGCDACWTFASKLSSMLGTQTKSAPSARSAFDFIVGLSLYKLLLVIAVMVTIVISIMLVVLIIPVAITMPAVSFHVPPPMRMRPAVFPRIA